MAGLPTSLVGSGSENFDDSYFHDIDFPVAHGDDWTSFMLTDLAAFGPPGRVCDRCISYVPRRLYNWPLASLGGLVS